VHDLIRLVLARRFGRSVGYSVSLSLPAAVHLITVRLPVTGARPGNMIRFLFGLCVFEEPGT
jgi:hypothetical protein